MTFCWPESVVKMLLANADAENIISRWFRRHTIFAMFSMVVARAFSGPLRLDCEHQSISWPPPPNIAFENELCWFLGFLRFFYRRTSSNIYSLCKFFVKDIFYQNYWMIYLYVPSIARIFYTYKWTYQRLLHLQLSRPFLLKAFYHL